MPLYPHRSARSSLLLFLLVESLLSDVAFAQTAQSTCATVVDIEATDQDSLLLREDLAVGLLGGVSASCCQGTRVSVTRSGESGFLVSVEQGGEAVSRQVASLGAAVALVESWLLPPDEVPVERGSGGGASPSMMAGAEASPGATPLRPEHRVATRLELNTALSLGADRALWAGPDVSVAALLTRSFWFGGGLGVSFWASNDRDGVRIDEQIPVLRVALRFGGRLRLGQRSALDLGGGLGISWDISLEKPVDPFGELLATLDVALGRNFSALFGLLGRAHMIREADRAYQATGLHDTEGDFEGDQGQPSTASLFSGELRIGLSYTFGRGR